MNFFEHQDQARRNTTKLLLLFSLSIGVMIAAFYGVAVVLVTNTTPLERSLWQPDLLLLVTVVMLALMTVGSAIKYAELQGGGPSLASSLGGRRIDPSTNDPGELRLLNVVSEMALASGTPIPAVYVLDQEAGINAFAAGYTADNAVIGVTRGCLDQLTRDELQGVIGHEFSHILNGDMGLNLRLIAIIHGLLLIYITGRVVLRLGYDSGRSRSSDNSKSGSMIFMAALSMVILGYLGVLGGRLIKSAVSREREFLADASAVQFTRNPQGIADALRKIGQVSAGSTVTSPMAETASHLFFGEATSGLVGWGGWFATHPPLRERIRRLGQVPLGDGPDPMPNATFRTGGRPTGLEDGLVMGLHGGGTVSPVATQTAAASPALPASQFVTAVGTIDPRRLRQVHDLLNQLPDSVKEALHDPTAAADIVFALMVRTPPTAQAQQVQILAKTYGPERKQQVGQYYNHLRRLDAHQVPLLIEAVVPALKGLDPEATATVLQTVKSLAHPSGKPILAAYAIQLILQKRLADRPANATPITSLDPLWPDTLAVLAMLARVGHSRPEDALYAFKLGLSQLPGAKKRDLPNELPKVSSQALSDSLERLEQAVPKLKQALVDGCAHTVLADNTVTPAEMELLRAVVISLDCPAPPFLG